MLHIFVFKEKVLFSTAAKVGQRSIKNELDDDCKLPNTCK